MDIYDHLIGCEKKQCLKKIKSSHKIWGLISENDRTQARKEMSGQLWQWVDVK